MGLAMPTLASGLLRGLSAYQQGKTQGEDRRMEQERQRRLEERQTRQDAMQSEMQRASMESMQAARARQQEQDRIAGEDRARADSEGGYRSQGQTQQLGDALAPAQGGMMGAGPLGAALPSIGRMSGDMLAASHGPAAFTRNGVGMVKAGESMQEREQRMRAQERQGERRQTNEDALARDRQNNEQADARLKREIAARDRSPSMQVIQTADGPMAFNPRTGQAQPITNGGKQVQGAPIGSGAGKLTDGQRRASGLVGIAEAEAKKMEEIGVPGWRDRALAKVPFGMGDALMTDKGQQYVAAAEAFARPYLYTVSGANAPEGEVRGNARTIIPGPFSGKNVTADMTGRRQRLLEGMKTIAGQPGAVSRDESVQAAKFRADARAEGYSDDEIDAELRRMGLIR